MKGTNKGKTKMESYEADAVGVVKRSPMDGSLKNTNGPISFLASTKLSFRECELSQVVSFDPDYKSVSLKLALCWLHRFWIC